MAIDVHGALIDLLSGGSSLGVGDYFVGEGAAAQNGKEGCADDHLLHVGCSELEMPSRTREQPDSSLGVTLGVTPCGGRSLGRLRQLIRWRAPAN
jgi:hypothetical protein